MSDMDLDFRHDLQKYSDARQAEREPGIGASSIDGCYKAHAYAYLGIPESDHRGTEAADLGTLLHLGWAAMIRSQFDPVVRDTEVVLHLDELPRSITADDVDYVNWVVRDVKTAKDTVWQSWLNRGTPYEHYWDQLHMYGLALYRESQEHAWSLCVTAINRETGQIAEYERPFDLERALALAHKAEVRHGVLTASASVVASGDASALFMVDTFPREGRGPGTGMPCDYCPWLSICWPSVPDGEDGTPQSVTVRDDSEQLGVLATEYLEASAESRKWETKRKDLQAFLVGNDGTYPSPDGGEISVRMVGGKPGADEPDCTAMVKRLEALGEPIPMRPGRSSPRWPRINRLKSKP